MLSNTSDKLLLSSLGRSCKAFVKRQLVVAWIEASDSMDEEEREAEKIMEDDEDSTEAKTELDNDWSTQK
eukprot:scaffold8928_cov41-Attheya_sp.AAC.1